MATVDAIVDEAQLYGFTAISDANCVSLLNQVYHLVNGMHPWPYLEATGTGAVSSGVVTMPATARAITAMYDATNDRLIKPISAEEWVERVAEPGIADASGESLFYRVVGELPGGVVTCWPVNNNTVTLHYIEEPADLAAAGSEASIALPPRHHSVLISGLVSRLYLLDEDFESHAQWDNVFMRRLELMENDLLVTSTEKQDAIRARVITRTVDHPQNVDNPQ